VSIQRDYKPVVPRQRRQVVRRHGLLVGALVLIGLFGGLLAYVKGDRQPTPATVAVPAETPTATVPMVAPTPIVAPESPPAPAAPKYDFYTELPKRQIEIQRDSRPPQGARQNSPSRAPATTEPTRRPAPIDRNAATRTAAVAKTA
jgi:hypothetical protein